MTRRLTESEISLRLQTGHAIPYSELRDFAKMIDARMNLLDAYNLPEGQKLSARARWGSSLSDPQIMLAIIEEWDRQCTCGAINRVHAEIDRWKSILRRMPSS